MREKNQTNSPEEKAEGEKEAQGENRGRLILDATCAQGDISYPTDLGLLNKARQETEQIIDTLYESLKGKLKKKPRTYRQVAKKDYLEVAKKRQPSRKQIRKALKKQLQYIKRNWGYIEQLLQAGATLASLSRREYKMLLVSREVYRQQLWMYEHQQNRIDDRIVSLSQPHIRPIYRGKAGNAVEFGAKLSASCFDGYVFLDRIDWNNFNESGELKA